jgi:hypothetical protein
METLIINVPDKKMTLVTQLLRELGVTIQNESSKNISAYQQNLLKISVWTDEDLKVFEENKKGFESWKPEEW